MRTVCLAVLVVRCVYFASMGDKVLINSPTYVGFANHLNNAGYKIVHSPMYRDEQGIWRMNFEDMERKIKENHIHAAVFCSPHNPTGRVWERWEIEKAMEVYQRHNVYVISDEIWSGSRFIRGIIISRHSQFPRTRRCARLRSMRHRRPSIWLVW